MAAGRLLSAVALVLFLLTGSGAAQAQQTAQFQVQGDSIPLPLDELIGDISRGRAIVVNRQKGLCLLCHTGPFPEERFQGNLAPSLAGAGSRSNAGQIRLRMVNSRAINRESIMPAYHSVDELNRVAVQFRGKPILTAQEIEDVVSFLMTLKE